MRMNITLLLTAAALLTTAGAARAQSGEPEASLPEPRVERIEDRTVIDLTMPRFFTGGGDEAADGGLEVRLFFDGDTSTSMYAIHADRKAKLVEKTERHGTPLLRYAGHNFPFITLGEVKREGDRITGEVSVRDRAEGEGVTGALKLDLTVDGEKVTGKYTDTADEDEPRTGSVTGTVRDVSKLGAGVDPIRDGYDWPQARGIDGLGSATPIDQPIVDTMAKGKFVWKSEARWPLFYTGTSSPIVAGDKVILNIHLPAGEKLYAGRVGRKYNTQKQKGIERYGRYSHDYRGLREADDVVYCIDAKTGLTQWQAVLPRRAINWQADQKAHPGNTACVADGKVFVVGYAGNLYALDLENGKLLWEGYHGGETGEQLRRARESIRETGAGMPSEQIIGPANSVATYHDGVLLVSSQYLGAVFAYDGATGKPLWRRRADLRVRGFVRMIETPDGKKHPCLIERAKEDGRRFRRAVVVDTKTGERLIETEIDLPKTGDSDRLGGYITWKNHLAALTGLQPGYFHQHNNPAGVAGFRLTDKGFEKTWERHLDKIGGAPHPLIVMEGRLHLGGHRDNRISNVEIATGKVHPHIPGTDGQGSYMQLTGGYGHLFRPSDQPTMVRAAADAEHLTELVGATFEHGYLQSTTDIALADGRLIVRQEDGLVCIDLRKPKD